MKTVLATLALVLLSGCSILNMPVPKDWRYMPGQGYVSTNPKDFNYIGNTYRYKSYRYNSYRSR